MKNEQILFEINGRGDNPLNEKIMSGLASRGGFSDYVSQDDYRQAVGVSSSCIRNYMTDPWLYHQKTTGKIKDEKKKSTNEGIAIHDYLLEGKKYITDKEKVKEILKNKPAIKAPKSTKQYRQWKEDVLKEGFSLIPEDVAQLLDDWMQASVSNDWLSTGPFDRNVASYEKSYWVLSREGLILKCRPDILFSRSGKWECMDIKKSGTDKSWDKENDTYGYWLQQAFYVYVLQLYGVPLELNDFSFLQFKTVQPGYINHVNLDGRMVSLAFDELIPEEIVKMKRSFKHDEWNKPWHLKKDGKPSVYTGMPEWNFRTKYENRY